MTRSSLSVRLSFLLLVTLTGACSIRKLAVDKIGDALSAESDVFASDDDPELIGQAVPFSLKVMESLLAENPRHPGLLLGAARGFTQYAYGWVQTSPSCACGESDAAHQAERARRLYIRARDYGLRGLEVRSPGFEKGLRASSDQALSVMTKRDVPLLYWTAASWGLAISLSKDKPDVLADLPLVGAMIDRALALDEGYGKGAIHSFLINYEQARAGGEGDPLVRARRHFDRAVELSKGTVASPFVTFAESVSVQTQNRAEFEELLGRALAIDVDAVPSSELENIIAQKHARELLAHADELFLDSPGDQK